MSAPEHAPENAAPFALASRTPAGWATAVAADVPALLSDHAHCELKAAASAMTLLRNHGQRADICLLLGPLLREEAEHAQRVLRELASRGHGLSPDRPNPYMDGLISAAGHPRRREDGLLDSLLVAALIEMRSHERFERLAECEELADLRTLYASLGEAEARHGQLFLELAAEVADDTRVRARFTEFAAAEATLLERLPFAHRVHSGCPRS
jgi:tRNA-(ms[2]io[6]A)-hydroxylase